MSKSIQLDDQRERDATVQYTFPSRRVMEAIPSFFVTLMVHLSSSNASGIHGKPNVGDMRSPK